MSNPLCLYFILLIPFSFHISNYSYKSCPLTSALPYSFAILSSFRRQPWSVSLALLRGYVRIYQYLIISEAFVSPAELFSLNALLLPCLSLNLQISLMSRSHRLLPSLGITPHPD